MSLLQSAPFLRAYRFLPHRLLNQGFRRLMQAERPRFLVQAGLRRWVRRGHIDLSEFEDRPYRSAEDLFLRRLRPGARPLGPGWIAPVDGRLVAQGALEDAESTTLLVKGQRLSIDRLVNGRHHRLPLTGYRGGRYLVLFLTPDGYHYIHMPARGEVRLCQWVPGRYFPQNDRALAHIPGVYERNERAVLQCRSEEGVEFIAILVAASLVGGIHLEGVPQPVWMQEAPISCSWHLDKGQALGHFSFGSTIVLLLPPGVGRPLQLAPGAEVRMGQTLW